ncbi:aromatic amino acid exporter YddG [Oceanobacter kriegii]|uniref:aromatic amino acid exporter YddG n=1 Tax=Oceanobacter kriegii TaxID=64972 RepID=UPI0003FACB39|nr:EamA family transporter [Oceanobacter kriegii]
MTVTTSSELPERSTALATLVGSTAVLLWGSLALFTRLSGGEIPPFQLMAVSFATAFMVMQIRWWLRGESGLQYARQPVAAWALGVGGYFCYHACYFAAMMLAPAVEVSLIAYLWPLFIVLLSTLVTGLPMRIGHVVGAVLALVGCWVLLSGGEQNAASTQAFDSQYLPGYGLAFLCSLIWSGFSVTSRKMKAVPTDAAGWFCLATAVLALLAHWAFEQTVWPDTSLQWLALMALGIGPVGIAFFTWDYGMKHGNLALLGVISYFAPLISVALLLLVGEGEWRIEVGVAAVAISLGALVASFAGKQKAGKQKAA